MSLSFFNFKFNEVCNFFPLFIRFPFSLQPNRCNRFLILNMIPFKSYFLLSMCPLLIVYDN